MERTKFLQHFSLINKDVFLKEINKDVIINNTYFFIKINNINNFFNNHTTQIKYVMWKIKEINKRRKWKTSELYGSPKVDVFEKNKRVNDINSVL